MKTLANATEDNTTNENSDALETDATANPEIGTHEDLEVPGLGGGAPYRFHIADYAALLKPRVMSLVVFTAVTGIVIAPGEISLFAAIISTLCVAFGAGASGAINMWYDRDIDQFMERTQNRPIPAGKVKPTQALVFGVIIAAVSVIVMHLFVNEQASGLLLFTILYYVFLYTMWLKRSTPQNIVIGGAAGAFPPMIGWVSVSGDFSLESGILFLIIFLWTPPHTWALALFRHGDYERVGVPMMPVVVGSHRTKVQMLVYTILLVIVTMIPGLIGLSGIIYTVVAAVLGGMFIFHCLKLLKMDTDDHARPTFLFSLMYLSGIFMGLLVDHFLLFPLPLTF
ncbi:MAG: protoheme IX farnesyltransferase [Rhodospirillaceae bacterium]|nr:MAG: protoheme IX farnesyltransferase [Rhodospirillaceae bacterium]